MEFSFEFTVVKPSWTQLRILRACIESIRSFDKQAPIHHHRRKVCCSSPLPPAPPPPPADKTSFRRPRGRGIRHAVGGAGPGRRGPGPGPRCPPRVRRARPARPPRDGTGNSRAADPALRPRLPRTSPDLGGGGDGGGGGGGAGGGASGGATRMDETERVRRAWPGRAAAAAAGGSRARALATRSHMRRRRPPSCREEGPGRSGPDSSSETKGRCFAWGQPRPPVPGPNGPGETRGPAPCERGASASALTPLIPCTSGDWSVLLEGLRGMNP